MFELFLNSKQWQNRLKKRKQNRKIKRDSTYLASPVQPTRAGPAPVLVQHCAAQPTPVATVFNLLPVGRRACARRARARSGHLLLTRSPLEAPEGATHSPQPLCPSLTLPVLLLPSVSLPRARPNATVAAARRCRVHRLPLASPTSPGAPPHRPRPLRQVKQAGMHRSTALSLSSTSDRRRSLSPPRSLRCFPEHAEATPALPASFSSFSP